MSFFYTLITSTLLALPVFIGATVATPAAETVKLQAEMGQKAVLAATKKQKVYLRVNLATAQPVEERRRAPINVAIVIDKSGSMRGHRLSRARKAAIMALEHLGKDDIVSVVAYDDQIDVVVPATRLRNRLHMEEMIDSLRAGGRTALYAGVRQGGRELDKFLDINQINRVILLSDGIANVGPSSPRELGKLGRKLAARGISVTTIGLGLGYNEDLMTRLALNSDGNHAFVEHPDDLVDIFNEEFADLLSVVAQQIEINIICNEGFVPRRVLGRDAHIDGNRVSIRLNQLYGDQKKYVVLELDAPTGKNGSIADVARVDVEYLDMATNKTGNASDTVYLEYSSSEGHVQSSINKNVMGDIVRQIATERNEEAVALRDRGKIGAARKVLEANAEYLSKNAQSLDNKTLEKIAEQNKSDAASLSGKQWNKTRKSMKAKQYKSKTQQRY
jgi:Ca-activated chloride channel family protein